MIERLRVTRVAPWLATGAISLLDLIALGHPFSGTVNVITCIAGLYSVPMLVLAWLSLGVTTSPAMPENEHTLGPNRSRGLRRRCEDRLIKVRAEACR